VAHGIASTCAEEGYSSRYRWGEDQVEATRRTSDELERAVRDAPSAGVLGVKIMEDKSLRAA
jgi:hypothetical protein